MGFRSEPRRPPQDRLLHIDDRGAAVRRFLFISIGPTSGEDFPLVAAKRPAEERFRATRLDVVLQPSYSPKFGSRQ
jgi:hypothetical protein